MYLHIAQYVIYYNHRNEIIIDERNIYSEDWKR